MLLCPWDFPGKNSGVGCHFLSQGIFPTQGSNSCLLLLLHWQVDSLPLSHLGSLYGYTIIHLFICLFLDIWGYFFLPVYSNYELLFSHWVMSNSLQPQELQHTRLCYTSLSPWICSNSCPLSQWCHPTISSSVIPFSCSQSFPASGFFPVSQLFASSGQSIGASASASVLPMNIHCWFPLGLTGLISLLSKGLSIISGITVWKLQFFGTWPSLWSSSHIHTWLLENHSFDYTDLCWQSDVYAF